MEALKNGIELTGTLYTSAQGDAKDKLAYAEQIWDDEQQKHQSEINKKLAESIEDVPNADEEDITVTTDNKLQLKDRDSSKGMGYKILRLPEDGILTQEMISEPNTIYEIRYDFDLNSLTITIPENCVLKFEGGKLENGSLNGTHSRIFANTSEIFNNITVTGTWNVAEAYPEWFGAKGDNNTDDTAAIQECVNSFKNTVLSAQYYITSINVDNKNIINRGTITVNGNNHGFVLLSYSSLTGGTINIRNNATAILIGTTSESNTRRVLVSDIKIYGEKTSNTCGIRLISKNSSYYNTFCMISNVVIYSCFYGLVGNIRASTIKVLLEQCYNNLDILGGLNSIEVLGQACPAHNDYPYFITIDGSLNSIISCVYDVGTKDYQKYLIDLRQSGNTLVNRIIASEKLCDISTYFSDDTSNNYVRNWAFKFDNPRYTVSGENISTDLNDIPFFDSSNNTVLFREITPVNGSGSITLEFDKVVGFHGISFYFISNDYMPDSMDVYLNDSLLTTIKRGTGYDLSYIPRRFEDFYKTAPIKVKVVLHLSKACRFVGAEFFAINHIDKFRTVGESEQRPILSVKNIGFEYFDTTINSPIYWDGTKWIDPASEAISWEIIR